jgi:hypothetical protein
MDVDIATPDLSQIPENIQPRALRERAEYGDGG